MEISRTLAGERELETKVAASADQGIISIFSPESSLITVVTRMPFWPTQEPTGSIFSSLDMTATLEREPGSLATDLISTTPEATSGASRAKSFSKNLG